MDKTFEIPDSSSESSLELPLSPAQQQLVDQLSLHKDKPNGQSTTPTTRHSIEVKANYVNLLLTAYGYPVPLIFDSKDENDIMKVLDCFQMVLQDIKKHQDERDEMNETIVTLQNEQDQTQTNLNRCLADLDKKEQEIAQAKIKAKSADEQWKKSLETNRHIKEELSKCKNNMQYMKLQYAHETRRHEQDHAKTRERLMKLMKEKLKTNVVSVTINNALPISEIDAEPKVTPLQNERAMNKDLLQKCTDREREARMESEDLRTALIKIYTTIRRLIETQVETFEDTVGTQKLRKETAQNIEKLKLPMDFGASMAMEQVNILLDKLQEEWNRQIVDRNVYTQEEMDEKDLTTQQWQSEVTELEETLGRLQQEHEQKEQVYLRFVNGGFFDEIAKEQTLELSDSESSVLEDDPQNLAHYHQLHQNAKKERERVTEAAIQLGNERTKLEAERWAFEEMKRQAKLLEIMETVSPPHETASSSASSQSKRQRLF
ncbi:Afadin and alpha-actinin-binding-domain-containing protein [Halteromyces radiatus]|uniref:Afadin and alpha-actinin-binding-domain-containing protein n=1 Tax=Halteromyces radiatus TaxID=101107 RepID=UPI00221FC3F0|nr:Afadin and alpha-actinin-binding-domain-containing protein [Halteromyces radiatus]KAI8077799.1 Afadin and alpha-actinin-binding-domain-containing protein [Halteromyces radiatus]